MYLYFFSYQLVNAFIITLCHNYVKMKKKCMEYFRMNPATFDYLINMINMMLLKMRTN